MNPASRHQIRGFSRKIHSKQPFTRLALVIGMLAVLLGGTLNIVTGRQAAAVQETDPEIAATLNAINMYRSWLGIAPLSFDPNLQQAAENHVEYYRLNFGDPNLSGMGLHMETPGNPGFTGETMFDRADAAGYDGLVNENAGLSGSMWVSTDWFIGTINHRLTLIDPRYTDIGMAAVDDDGIVFEIINLGTKDRWDYVTEPEWVAWPPDGATGVGLSFWGEAPNPFPGATFPTGYPITLQYHGEGDLYLNDWSITTEAGEISSFASVGSGWLSTNTAQISAADSLEPGVEYTVMAAGTAGGAEFSRTWSFTTSYGDDPLALNGESPPRELDEPPDDPFANEPAGPPDPSLLPPGIATADVDVQQLWFDADGPVHLDQVNRSWLWGPDFWLEAQELYMEAPDGQRKVYYFDKARIEVNEATEGRERQLTAGLLVRDMILGSVQVGDDAFLPLEPANVELAGDPLEDNPTAPTYASLRSVASISQPSNAQPRPDEAIIETIDNAGIVSSNPELGGLAIYGSWDETSSHNVARVFDQYFTTLAIDWQVSVGLPLIEPYWMQTMLKGEMTWVLVQAFERRILTYTPTNDPGWEVEMGNVGRHYYLWRYQEKPPEMLPGTAEIAY